MFLQSNSVVQHYVFFFPPDGWQRSVRFAGVPSCKYRWVASMLFLTGRFKHLFRLVVHSLPFKRSVFGPTTAVLLNNAAKDWGDFVVVLLELRWALRRFHISSTAAIDFLFPSRYCSQDIAAWKNFRKIRRSRCWSCRRSSPVIFCWTCWSSASGSSPEERFLVLVVLELLDQLLDLFLTCCILLLDCRKKYSRNSVTHGVAANFPATLRVAWWVPKWSCVLALWILLTVLRVRFKYNPWHSWRLECFVEKLLLRLRAYRFLTASCRWCVKENRLDVTVFGKFAKPCSWASFKLHQHTVFWRRFQVFLYGAILGFVRSRGVSPMPYPFHCSEEHSLSFCFEAFSSWNQSISDYWIQFTRVPVVADVLGKSFR